MSAATVRTASTPCCGRTTKMIERTRSRDGHGAAGDDQQRGGGGVGRDRNQADIRFACSQLRARILRA